MSTGQTSVSFAARAWSDATSGETSTSMKRLDMRTLRDPGPHHAWDVLDPLGDLDPGRGQARDLLRRGVLLALDDRAGVAEGHARHLVHEAARHEGHDRQPRLVLDHPLRELRLHPAARLRVNHDGLRLLVGLEVRHQLGVGGADDRVAADRHRGRLAEAGGGQGRGHLGRHAARARDDADGAGGVRLGRIARGAADAAHLDDVGDDDPEAVGPDDARAVLVGELDHLGDVAARDPLRDDDDELDAVVDRLDDRVLGEGGRDGDDRAVDRRAVVLDGLADGVEHRHAVDLPAEAARGHAADDPRAGAVVEALAREVDGLAPGDPLDDEGRVGVDQDRHQAATAIRAASFSDTERSAYLTPYFSRILKPSSSHAPGMRKIEIFSAGSWPSSMQALITPRATMSTRVLETIDIITAILSTPGFWSTSLARPHAFATDGLPPISQ